MTIPGSRIVLHHPDPEQCRGEARASCREPGRSVGGSWGDAQSNLLAGNVPADPAAILAGAILAFTLSFDEVVVTFFLTGREKTLPLLIWGRLRQGISPEINAAATIIIAVSLAGVLLSNQLSKQAASGARHELETPKMAQTAVSESAHLSRLWGGPASNCGMCARLRQCRGG